MTATALKLITVLFSVILPQKMWYPPGQPVTVTNSSAQPVQLVLTDFTGKPITTTNFTQLAAGASIDLSTPFPQITSEGAWILYAAPKGTSVTDAPPKDFVGTPIVIEDLVGADMKPMVTHLVPLQYAKIDTDAGSMKALFYYDAAPHTVESFLTLSAEGFYDSLVFHRIVPDFVIQGGDPTGTGTGGSGYHLDAEFNDKPHVEGVLSMARSDDPNSGSTQFFICLNYANTQQLDHKYTGFGRVIDGADVYKKIGASTIADQTSGRPDKLTTIQSITVYPVTAAYNPYAIPQK